MWINFQVFISHVSGYWFFYYRFLILYYSTSGPSTMFLQLFRNLLSLLLPFAFLLHNVYQKNYEQRVPQFYDSINGVLQCYYSTTVLQCNMRWKVRWGESFTSIFSWGKFNLDVFVLNLNLFSFFLIYLLFSSSVLL